MDSKNAVIELADVTFSYAGVPVLENVNFSLNKGDFAGIIGPNGGGKSTIVKLILGFLKPDKGEVRLFGEKATPKSLQRIGYVPQKATNFDHFFPATALEVASMGRFTRIGVMKRLSHRDYEIIGKALKDVGMSDMSNKRIGDLSGGQQQRVFIARALAAEPDVLILDEPLTGVDMESQHKFYDLVEHLNKEMGLTILLVSHDVKMITKSINKLVCVNINVTAHDVTNGVTEADLVCAYPAGLESVPHHHDKV